ncbi:hypothetical protein VQ042_08150 [Aurantimonas sp. A2-1-M11]|uniref:hypothetical protein n=1 Tax=Aurantimonas sp. A2-1-M11 TaxID=3113712 RepID=UPI002F930E20
MNVHTHSTTGGNAPADRGAPSLGQLTDAVGRLEAPQNEAMNMARIAALLAEDSITDYHAVPGGRAVTIDDNRAEALTWAVYQTETLFKAALAQWEDANHLTFAMRRAS